MANGSSVDFRMVQSATEFAGAAWQRTATSALALKRTPITRGLMILVLSACVSAANASGTPQVAIDQGALVGKQLEGGGALFAGIPYAAPPLGNLRWQPPAPAQSWEGVRDAQSPGATCVQPDMGWNSLDHAREAEDCLTLNVWVPENDGGGLPVMVCLHGGAFLGGSGSSPIYDGSSLIGHGVILVTVNYRLGVLGFLAHPQLSAASPDHVSGNYGLLDQAAALAWVHENIEPFGGDPDNVTVFGQSAGSLSTAALVTMPEARRHFRRAILESGTPFGIGELQTLDQAEKANADFGDIAGLRELPADQLVAQWAAWSAASPGARRAAPLIDGHVLRTSLTEAYMNGVAHDVPLLVGSNIREIAPASEEQVTEAANRLFGSEKAAEVLDIYRRTGNDPAAGDPGTQFMTDMQFRCGTVLTARNSDRSWLYHFFEAIPSRPAPAHSSEVPYVFSTPASLSRGPRKEFNEAEEALSRAMAIYWTNFARSGDPNGPQVPEWPRFSQDEAYVELKAGGIDVKHGLRGEFCAPFIQKWSEN